MSAAELRAFLPEIVDTLQEVGLSIGTGILSDLKDIEDLSDGEIQTLIDKIGLGTFPIRIEDGRIVGEDRTTPMSA